ncbi:presenilin family intramembrane aspartyl protease PSH [Halobacteriales archaeon Cl-PHB]
MDQRRRAAIASAGIALIFLLVQVGALALVEPFKAAGYQPVENPDNPTNSLFYLVAILVMTGLLLAAIKLDLQRLLRGFIVLAGAYIALFVFGVVVPAAGLPAPGGFHLLAWAGAAVLAIVLWVHPEWYVIDAAGVVMGIGATGMFGITFGIFPAILLLTVLAVYDAISVYGTEHMLTLASGVMEMRVPVVLVVPLTLSYSFLDGEMPNPTADGGEAADDEGQDEPVETDEAVGESAPEVSDRDALFIGLGDAVIPAVLVASAGYFLTDVPTLDLLGLTVPVPAATAMVGTFVGLAILLRMVLAGRAHAGLPLLNGGTIAGYLVGALASGLTIVEALGVGSFL